MKQQQISVAKHKSFYTLCFFILNIIQIVLSQCFQVKEALLQQQASLLPFLFAIKEQQCWTEIRTMGFIFVPVLRGDRRHLIFKKKTGQSRERPEEGATCLCLRVSVVLWRSQRNGWKMNGGVFVVVCVPFCAYSSDDMELKDTGGDKSFKLCCIWKINIQRRFPAQCVSEVDFRMYPSPDVVVLLWEELSFAKSASGNHDTSHNLLCLPCSEQTEQR